MSKAWMPLFVGDYLGDTAHLTQGQHGAYFLLMMHYWQRGPIPCNRMQCYCIARAMDELERSNVDVVLDCFFRVTEDHYRQSRLDAELEKAETSYKRRACAAGKRWDKAKDVQSSSNGHALHKQSYSNPSDSDSDSKDLETQVFEVAKLYPKVRDSLHVRAVDQEAIGSAIARDGDLVIAKTKIFRAAYDRWPVEERNFAFETAKFFNSSEYKADPTEWERKAKAQRIDGWAPPPPLPPDISAGRRRMAEIEAAKKATQ